MFKRFQTKLVFLFAALFILIQALTYSSVYVITSRNLEQQAKQQLSYSQDIFTQIINGRAERLLDEATILSSDFGFRAAVTTEDNATVMSALDNLVNRIGADTVMLMSLDSEILAASSESPLTFSKDFPTSDLIDAVEEQDISTTFVLIDDKLYEFTIVPVLAPVPVAWVGIGRVMDRNIILDVKKGLPDGIDITFMGQSSVSDDKYLKTTLTEEVKNTIKYLPLNKFENLKEPEILNLEDNRYMILSSSLASPTNINPIYTLITYSLDVAFSPYRPLVYALLSLLGLGLLSLISGSVYVARSVSKPLRFLAHASRKIQFGDYTTIPEIRQKDEIGQLAHHFNQMMLGIQEREERITFQAEHDMETGFPNLIKLKKYIQRLLDNDTNKNQNFSIVQFSLDQFDDVRNTLGYETGSELIKKVGLRLSLASPETSMLARLSTVSFCLVLPTANIKQACKMAREVLSLFEAPFDIDGFTIDVNIRVGIATYPDHAYSADMLIQRANIAVISAGDNIDHIDIYDKSKDSYKSEKLSLMGDFRKSLEQGHVVFYYQPKINLALNQITHVEALVRWDHPERGFIPPDDFITMAEQTGHIHLLTQWGLETVIKQSGIWSKAGIDLKIAFNLSAHDLSNKKLPDLIASLFEKYQVTSDCLVLEVTENAVMKDPDLALSVLKTLDEQGIMLSIDDYGTGYSSMSYLKKLPVKELKVDRSFVLNLATNKEDEILVRSTIELGHNLGLKVTAEGLEDKESLEILRDLGCDLAQGYFFSRPLPVRALEEFLRQSPLISLSNSTRSLISS